MSTTTIHQALLQAASAALQALPGVPASSVHVELPTPLDAADCPAINLLADGAQFQHMGSDSPTGLGLLRATVGLRVRIHTQGQPHTQVADPLIAQVHAVLMSDASLGGLALRLQLVETKPTQDARDGGAGIWELGYHATAAVDEATLAPAGV